MHVMYRTPQVAAVVSVVLEQLTTIGAIAACGCAGDSDDAFYSPKSNASFSDGSFTSTQEMVGRSPSGDLDFSGEPASASALQAC